MDGYTWEILTGQIDTYDDIGFPDPHGEYDENGFPLPRQA